MYKLRIFSVLSVVVIAASCATVPPSQQEDPVLEVLQFIETSQTENLVQHSGVPFLLDAEIVEAESDIAVFWHLLSERGYQFPSPHVDGITAVNEDSYLLFGDSMEVRVFFERYVPDDAAVAEVTAGNNRYRFLFANRVDGRGSLPLVYGWKGPL